MLLTNKKLKLPCANTAAQAKQTPLITTLISTYNNSATLNQCLRSVKNQSFTDYEIIIVDDASSDETPNIIKKWQQIFVKNRFLVITNKTNLGLTKSLNLGLAKARSAYIARLDADDIWTDDKLLKQCNILKNNPRLGVIGSWYATYFDNRTYIAALPVSNEKLKASIFRSNPFGHSCVIINKKLLQQVGGYNTKLRYGQDRDLWFRLLKQTDFYNIPQVLCHRRADKSISILRSRHQMRQGIKTQLKYIRYYHAPLINYLYLLLPLLIIITPAWLKRLRRHITLPPASFPASSPPGNILCINDRPLLPTRAETIARVAMSDAFAHMPSTKSVNVIFHGPSNPNLFPQHNKLRPTNTKNFFRLIIHPLPLKRTLLYLRCGALASFIFTLRNFFHAHPLVIEVHNFSFGTSPLADFLYKFAFNRATKLITISNITKLNWAKHGINPQRIIVLPSGVDLKSFSLPPAPSFSLRREFNLPPAVKTILYSGNMYRHRGLEDILAAAHILSDRKNIHFILMGGNAADISYYQNYVSSRYTSLNNVTFAGWRGHHEIPDYLKTADIILVTYSRRCPTINTMSPIKLLEALASGTPAIVADLPRTGAIASDKLVTFYSPDDPQSLASNISAVLENYSSAARKAKLSQKHAMSYSWQNRAINIVNSLW